MRLIDADALMVQMADGPYNCPGDCGCCDPDMDLKIDGKVAFGCSAVMHAPTVDAMPMEWLEWRIGHAEREGFVEIAKMLRTVRDWWNDQRDLWQEERKQEG